MSIVPYINALWPLPSCVNLTTYVQGMSDYEIICAILQKLNEVVHSFNSLDDAVTDLSSKFDSLKSFVDNYFENLDVQEEINNKLDEMVQSGALEQIFAKYFGKPATPQLYGAKGDGVTDDTQAFIDLFKDNKCIYIPEGVYKLTRPIDISNALNIDGCGTISGYGFYSNSKLEYFSMTGITFDTPGNTAFAAPLIFASISGVTVNEASVGFSFGSESWIVSVTNTNLLNCSESCMTGEDQFNSFTFTGCHFQRSPHVLMGGGLARTVLFSGCDFEFISDFCFQGIQFQPGTISSCYFENVVTIIRAGARVAPGLLTIENSWIFGSNLTAPIVAVNICSTSVTSAVYKIRFLNNFIRIAGSYNKLFGFSVSNTDEVYTTLSVDSEGNEFTSDGSNITNRSYFDMFDLTISQVRFMTSSNNNAFYTDQVIGTAANNKLTITQIKTGNTANKVSNSVHMFGTPLASDVGYSGGDQSVTVTLPSNIIISGEHNRIVHVRYNDSTYSAVSAVVSTGNITISSITQNKTVTHLFIDISV